MENATVTRKTESRIQAIAGGLGLAGLYGGSVFMAVSLVVAALGGPIGQFAGTGTSAAAGAIDGVVTAIGTLVR